MFVSLVLLIATAKKRIRKGGASSGHITNLKQSIFSFDIYGLNETETLHNIDDSLPKIVPNVLLAKRDELIPLLLLSIHHVGDEHRRDQLLNLLFNLIKRPDESQRAVIVAGFKKIAENFPERIESELMPQIWEQVEKLYNFFTLSLTSG